mgnify:CR=1 FL=1
MQDILAKEFRPKRIIDNPPEEKLREWALEQGGVITEFGNLSVVTKQRNRMAKFTKAIINFSSLASSGSGCRACWTAGTPASIAA